MDGLSAAIDRLRQPAYTGENRCLPCTAVNVLIALGVAAVAGLVWLPLGGAALLATLALIYVRGYLVPGTPTLTKRYLPDRVLAYFEHGEVEVPTDDGDDEEEWETLQKLEQRRENEVEPEAFLSTTGAIREGEDGLVLTDAFRERIDDQLMGFGEDGPDDATVAETFDGTAADVERLDEDHPAVRIETRVRRWPSEAAFRADVAADAALRAASDEWADVPLKQRVDMLEALRSFRDTCPSCGGTVGFEDRVVDSCCRSFDVVTVACEDCEARMLELPPHATDEIAVAGGTLR